MGPLPVNALHPIARPSAALNGRRARGVGHGIGLGDKGSSLCDFGRDPQEGRRPVVWMTCPPDRPHGTGAIAGCEVVAVPSRPIKSCFVEDGRFGDAFTDKGACRSDIGRRRRMIERGDTTAL